MQAQLHGKDLWEREFEGSLWKGAATTDLHTGRSLGPQAGSPGDSWLAWSSRVWHAWLQSHSPGRSQPAGREESNPPSLPWMAVGPRWSICSLQLLKQWNMLFQIGITCWAAKNKPRTQEMSSLLVRFWQRNFNSFCVGQPFLYYLSTVYPSTHPSSTFYHLFFKPLY